jgi:outer membrane protein assembly factor BamB
VQSAWKTSVGKAGRYLFSPVAVDDAIYAAAENGVVAKIDAQTGHDIWRVKLHHDLSAGVGSDGNLSAVGGLKGDVYVLDQNGRQLWHVRAPGEIISPPLVGNGLVIVRTIDGQVIAYDAQTADQKWVYRNREIPLNLRISAGMTFAGNAAVLVGFPGGEFVAINLQTGDEYWEAPVSYPKGVTEVERVNDVSGPPTLLGATTCAVTFQGRIGCFDVNSGRELWTQSFSSASGIAQSDQVVVGADDTSVINAYNVADGKLAWSNGKLKNRSVGVPYVSGHTAALGDYQGYVHFLSLDNGEFVARVKTDGSAITAAPVFAGETLVVQTRNGNLYGLRPH